MNSYASVLINYLKFFLTHWLLFAKLDFETQMKINLMFTCTLEIEFNFINRTTNYRLVVLVCPSSGDKSPDLNKGWAGRPKESDVPPGGVFASEEGEVPSSGGFVCVENLIEMPGDSSLQFRPWLVELSEPGHESDAGVVVGFIPLSSLSLKLLLCEPDNDDNQQVEQFKKFKTFKSLTSPTIEVF